MLASYVQSALLRLDGWANEVTGLGTAALDKTVAALFASGARYGDLYFAGLYDEDALARRICDKVPDEMTRAGFVLRMGDAANGQQLSTDLADKLKSLQAVARIKDGMVWERVFGGTAVLLGADDGESDPAKPLNEEKLQDITHLTVIDKPRIFAKSWYPVTDPKAGQVELWTVAPLGGNTGSEGQIEVHETRLLIFGGGRVTHQKRIEQQGWGHGVLRACHDVLRDYNMSWAGITYMLQSANQDVWYMSGLKNALTGGTEAMKEYFAARFSMAQMRMGPNRAVTLDSDGEKFERHSSTLTGVPETMQQVCLRLSAATDMPSTVLFGMSPAGLNATGESDLKIWNSAVGAMQIERLAPPLERLIRLILISKLGPTKGKEPKGWSIKFNELAVLSDVEQAEIRNKQADTDAKYVTAQVLLPEEIACNRFRQDGWNAETTIDLDARKQILEAELERAVEDAIDPPEPPPTPPITDPNNPDVQPPVPPKPGEPPVPPPKPPKPPPKPSEP